MEIKKIKIAGREVTAIYNCGSYIFYSNYYGVIGIASRTAITENHEPTYLLAAGTENTVGGSMNRSSIVAAMKRYITKCESFYKVTKTIFEDSGEICNCQIEFQLIEQTK